LCAARRIYPANARRYGRGEVVRMKAFTTSRKTAQMLVEAHRRIQRRQSCGYPYVNECNMGTVCDDCPRKETTDD
jgi:hypothetical protein